MPPDNERGRPGGAASETSWETTATADTTRPFRRTSCTRDCPDCRRTGRVGLRACTRPTQWLRRVGYGDLFGRAA